jgi:hypothetical protein
MIDDRKESMNDGTYIALCREVGSIFNALPTGTSVAPTPVAPTPVAPTPVARPSKPTAGYKKAGAMTPKASLKSGMKGDIVKIDDTLYKVSRNATEYITLYKTNNNGSVIGEGKTRIKRSYPITDPTQSFYVVFTHI